MSETMLTQTLLAVATELADHLPAAYGLTPLEPAVGDDAPHQFPLGELRAVRLPLTAAGDAHVVVVVGADAADVLLETRGAADLAAALEPVLTAAAARVAPLLADPLAVGTPSETPADEVLLDLPGFPATVALDDEGTLRATIGLVLKMTEQMLTPAPTETPTDAVEEPAPPAPAAVADGQPAATPAAAPAAGAGPARPGPRPVVDEGQVEVRAHEFAALDQVAALPAPAHSLQMLGDVEMGLTAVLGRTSKTVREALELTPGAIVELDRAAGSPVDIVVNGTLIARGEVVVIDEEYGIRITEIVGYDATSSAVAPAHAAVQ